MAAGLPRAAVHSQLASAVDVVLHLHRGRDGRRRLAEVAVLSRRPDGVVEAVPAARFGSEGEVEELAAADTLGRLLVERLRR